MVSHGKSQSWREIKNSGYIHFKRKIKKLFLKYDCMTHADDIIKPLLVGRTSCVTVSAGDACLWVFNTGV